jgi:hypothetical protein
VRVDENKKPLMDVRIKLAKVVGDTSASSSSEAKESPTKK